MKFFRKKTSVRLNPVHKAVRPDSDHNFYSRNAGEVPLDEYFDVAGTRQMTRRTSRHSPARVRETSNRASNWAISLLLLRAVLIVLLLVGGFIVLKLVLDRMAEPSKQDQQQWESNVVRMGKIPASAPYPATSALVVGPELIERRLEQWKQTEQQLRSAEALSRRGIDDEAIQRLGLASRITPDNREAQQMLVDLYMRRGLYAEAVPLCIRLLDQNGQQQDLQMKLLQALQASGQIEAGLVLAERLLLDQPNNLTVLSIAATGQIARGNTTAALTLFERMLENDDKNKDALKNCGKIYFDLGEYEKAVPYYLELVRLDPKPEHYQMLARAYAQQSQAGKAVIFMGQAASLFGGTEVSSWLKESVFDPVRETVEFRSFADRIVGIETRKAIEAINKRAAEKAKMAEPGGLNLPQQPDLQAIRPGKQ